MECKSCGGECRDIGGGKFRCVFCGAEFTDSAAPKSEPQPAPTAAQQHSYLESAVFKTSSGWRANGKFLDNLADDKKAAEYLRDVYVKYLWSR